MTDHTQIEELLAARALGGLTGADAATLDAALAEHGPACEECRRLEREFTEVAAALAMELEPAPLREGFEEHVMAAARATSRPVTIPTPDRTDQRWARRLGALAAAAALLLGGFALGRLTDAEGGPPADFLTILRLQGDAPGAISVAYRPGEAGGYILGSDIPAAAGGDVYALWTISGETPTLLGCFSPEDGEILGSFDLRVDQADLMAVTVEPPACPDAPTTTPILASEIQTA